jgi:hypothetical protein
MNDDSLYTLIRTEFEPVRVTRGLDEVTARGYGIRRRRRVAGFGVALAVAVAAVLALILPPDRPAPSAPMQLAAWSVDPRPDGTVVLTIRQLLHADELTVALKTAGVPSLVEFEQVDPATARVTGCEEQQPALPQLNEVMPPRLSRVHGAERTFEIRRAAMPAGTSLHFVIFGQGDGGSRFVQTSLVRGVPIPCKLLK